MPSKDDNPHTLFHPVSVAAVVASRKPGKLAYHVMKSLTQDGFKGAIFPINPGEAELFGAKVYSALADVPHDVDLEVLVLPGQAVAEIIQQLAAKGVGASWSLPRGLGRSTTSGGQSCSER